MDLTEVPNESAKKYRSKKINFIWIIMILFYYRSYADELGPKHWPDSRFIHVLQLRQAALRSARAQWADYILVSYMGSALAVLSHAQ